MNNSGKSILETITQEIRLPQINADACVHSLCQESDCNACVIACPTEAWLLDNAQLGLDIDACNGCGLCIPACPVGALHIDFPWVIRSLGYRMVALFACEQSDIKASNGIIPCLHDLGVRQLLQLYKGGIETLLVTSGDCLNCHLSDCLSDPLSGMEENLFSRVKQLNSLLLERDKQPIKLLQNSAKVWHKIYSSDETINCGMQLSRRNFLRGGGQKIREQLVIIDPLNLPEYRTIPPGQLLPETENNTLKWISVPDIDKTQCNGCDACIRICPSDALQLIYNKDNQPQYSIEAVNCTACGLCTSVCQEEAVSITHWSYVQTKKINLSETRCTACGNEFHYPKEHLQTKHSQSLCRICREHNHSNNLFQVLE